MGNIVTEKYIKWQKREANAEQIKTTTPYERMLTLNARDVHPGTYKVHWYYEVKLDALPSPSEIIVRVQAKTNVVAFNQIRNPQDEYESFGGWDFIKLKERETPIIFLEWRRVGGAADLHAQHVRLSIELMEGDPGPRGNN